MNNTHEGSDIWLSVHRTVSANSRRLLLIQERWRKVDTGQYPICSSPSENGEWQKRETENR